MMPVRFDRADAAFDKVNCRETLIARTLRIESSFPDVFCRKMCRQQVCSRPNALLSGVANNQQKSKQNSIKQPAIELLSNQTTSSLRHSMYWQPLLKPWAHHLLAFLSQQKKQLKPPGPPQTANLLPQPATGHLHSTLTKTADGSSLTLTLANRLGVASLEMYTWLGRGRQSSSLP